MRKILAALVASGVLAAGAAGSTVLSGSSVAIAQTPSADGTEKSSGRGFKGGHWRGAHGLGGLVKDGTITMEQAQAVYAALKANRPARAADGTELTPEQFRAQRERIVDTTLAALVAAGTITADQSAAIKEAFANIAAKKERMLGRFGLALLVKDGTITGEQAKAVVAALKANKPERAADGTRPDKEQLRAQYQRIVETTLAELVTKGTITTAQADAIKKALAKPGWKGSAGATKARKTA